MLPDFLDEANENISRLNEHLLLLDEQVKAADGADGFDAGLLNDMFRAAHTLKGLSGMLGLNHINALTHKVENVFDAARNSELPITPKVVEVVFQSLDRLGEMLERLKDGQNDEVDCEVVIADIGGLLQKSGVEKKQATQKEAEESMRQLVSATDASTELQATAVVPPEQAGDIFSDIQDDVDFSSKYISIFLDEAELTLDQLTESLLAGADENTTEHALVLCHRMKGSAATVGLNRAAKLAHYMEDLLQVLRENGSQLSVPMTDAMLDCTESLRVYVSGLKNGESHTNSFAEAYHNLIRSQSPNATITKATAPPQRAESIAPAAVASPATSPELTTETCVRIAAAAPPSQPCCIGQIEFREGLADVGLKARLLYEKLLRVGELFYCDPPESALDDAENLRVMLFGLTTEGAAEALREIDCRRCCTDRTSGLERILRGRREVARQSELDRFSTGCVRRESVRHVARATIRQVDAHGRNYFHRQWPQQRGGHKGRCRQGRRHRQTHRDGPSRHRQARSADEPGGPARHQPGPFCANRHGVAAHLNRQANQFRNEHSRLGTSLGGRARRLRARSQHDRKIGRDAERGSADPNRNGSHPAADGTIRSSPDVDQRIA